VPGLSGDDEHGAMDRPKTTPTPIVRFDIRSIPKKPPAPSVRRRVKAKQRAQV
jgi:hypothetical protein